jgi:NMD protein affecting ribosome stability and mRNA decay
MVVVNFCRECGEELQDVLDVEAGICMDCQMDGGEDAEMETEDE